MNSPKFWNRASTLGKYGINTGKSNFKMHPKYFKNVKNINRMKLYLTECIPEITHLYNS